LICSELSFTIKGFLAFAISFVGAIISLIVINTMLKDIKKLLIPMGLSESEINVFLAMVQVGPEAISRIAKMAGHNRVSVYDILRRLSEKGLVRQITRGGVKKYEAVEPGVILRKLNEEKETIEEKLVVFKDLRPELNALYGGRYDQPSVSFYEGLQGVKNILLDTLETHGVEEILSYASADYLKAGFEKDFLEKYWQKRVSMKIPSRGIIPATSTAKSIFIEEKNIRELRRVKFVLAEKYNFTNEIDIYADKVSIISLDPKNLYGVIIKSESIADTQKNIYELLWNLL